MKIICCMSMHVNCIIVYVVVYRRFDISIKFLNYNTTVYSVVLIFDYFREISKRL